MSLYERAHPALAAALDARGYREPTPVQSAILEQDDPTRDLLVSAQTGSGKTVAFGLALAGLILPSKGLIEEDPSPLALVIAPTRELACRFGENSNGFMPKPVWQSLPALAAWTRALNGAHLREVHRSSSALRDVCAIISRVVHWSLVQSERLCLMKLDEMLDLGFREDLEFILKACPAERRTLMFSATLPGEVTALAKQFQKNAQRLSIGAQRDRHGDIEYIGYEVLPRERDNAIVNILRYHDAPGSIIFCSTRESVKRLTSRLANRGFSTVALSGEFTQSERTNALQVMRDGRSPHLRGNRCCFTRNRSAAARSGDPC